jgi:hypothetical protein
VVLVLEGYFDDSGTHGDTRVVVWGGFLGTVDQWVDLDRRWREKLAKPLPNKARLKKFALADCRWAVEEFESYSYAERDLIQADFRQLIIDVGVIGMAYAVDRHAYTELMSQEAQNFFGDPEMMCFGECFHGAIYTARTKFADHAEMALHFDQGRHSGKLAAIVDVVDRTIAESPKSRASSRRWLISPLFRRPTS